jgi:hypothetical protein
MDRWFQCCHTEVTGGAHGLGLGFRQFGELLLDVVDFPGEVGRVDALDPCADDCRLLGVEDAGVLDALPWGFRFVVYTTASPVAGGGVFDGFLRGGEEVQAQRYQPP